MASDELRQDMVDQVREEQQQRQRAPRVHKAPVARDAAPVARDPSAADVTDINRPDATPEGEAGMGDAPKKRRRRRRPSGPKTGGESMPDNGA